MVDEWNYNSLQRIAIEYESSSDEEPVLRKRSKREYNSCSQLRKSNYIKRMIGKKYLGFSTIAKKIKQNRPKPQRKMGPKCSSKFCLKSKLRWCNLFEEDERKNIFEQFWKLSWEGKKMFVKSHVSELATTTKHSEKSKRYKTFIYKLSYKHKLLQVCKLMFLSTLGINRSMAIGWVVDKVSPPVIQNQQRISDSKVRDSKLFLKTYLQNLEKTESHYCRQKTTKLYLSECFKTKTDVYNDYPNICSLKQVNSLSYFTFSRTFDDENYAIFKPRKDECDTCVGYKTKQISAEEYKYHIAKIERAQIEKTLDKIKSQNKLCHVFTMDTQAVKLCPDINASAVYYKQRLQVHNFTIYNIGNHQCSNYWWSEIHGDLSASSFVTCIINHLEVYCLSDMLPIILYSDGCGYQNRNHILANALSNFSIRHNKVIEQKYLEKGHTQMECDSAHAKIEKKLKNQSVYLPIEYVTYTKEARKTVKIDNKIKKMPFDAIYLNYDFFKNYNDQELIRFSSIRPGKGKNDPTVSQLRSILYLPNGCVKYKTNFDDQYTDLPCRIKKYEGKLEPKPLHSKQLPIQLNKWKHLQELKKVIPQEYHYFYDNLLYTKSN
ncbi:uncharacterized protein LOC124419864 [Lucilia cuprina]|uniref:uncharacterized protein LOC124419864 n=1 Tax=Lucilia cuprina TaxID=7375 RepID=UPI001F05FB58|nr:uncharacterized protein LOC124419864 [Lucilia cuprina]